MSSPAIIPSTELYCAPIPPPPPPPTPPGNLKLLTTTAIAIVGSRQPTPYARAVLERFIPPLVQHHLTIISGLAHGVDGLAHRLTLEQSGSTIAILGSGIDRAYPRTHQFLYQEITNRGLILSEYAAATPPTNYSFPLRNRLISGFSAGVLVVEARLGSGSLLTAAWAQKLKRPVWVVPGSIFTPGLAGSHQLLRTGSARLVDSPTQILSDLGINLTPPPAPTPLPPHQQTVWELLTPTPQHLSQLVLSSHFGTQELNSTLTELALLGRARESSQGWWAKI